MSKDNKTPPTPPTTTNAKDYADRLRGRESTALTPPTDPPPPSALGLATFDGLDSGDISMFDPTSTRRELAARGYTMVERYLSLEPWQGVKAFVLGWSGTLIPDMQDPTKLRYVRKLHLELPSGARVSMIEAAQLAGLFSVPMDGSASVAIYRGGEQTLSDGRRMGQWECHVALGARKATHDPGTTYAQVASEAALRNQLQLLSLADLSRVDNAPQGLLDPYLSAARQREVDAEIQRRDIQKRAAKVEA